MSSSNRGATNSGWERLPNHSISTPGVQCHHTLVRFANRCLVLFGANGVVFEYDLVAQQWRRLSITDQEDGASSPNVHSHSAVVHGSEMIIFGGQKADQKLSDELWSLNLIPRPLLTFLMILARQGKTGRWGHLSEPNALSPILWCLREYLDHEWTRVEVATQPPEPRSGHSAICIRDRMIVFGGHDGTFCLNDVWEYDFGTQQWQMAPPRAGGGPTPRMYHSAVRYAVPVPNESPQLALPEMFIFGGVKYKTMLNDLWAYDAGFQTWRCVDVGGAPPSAPHVRYGHAAAIAPDRRWLLVYGGHIRNVGPTPSERCADDLWAYDFSTKRWLPCTTADAPTFSVTGPLRIFQTSTPAPPPPSDDHPEENAATPPPATKPKPVAPSSHKPPTMVFHTAVWVPKLSHGKTKDNSGNGEGKFVVVGGICSDMPSTARKASAGATPATPGLEECEVWAYSVADERTSSSCVIQ